MTAITFVVKYGTIIVIISICFLFLTCLIYYKYKKNKKRQFNKYANIGLYEAYDDKWQCPSCSYSNTNIIFICKSCGYNRTI